MKLPSFSQRSFSKRNKRWLGIFFLLTCNGLSAMASSSGFEDLQALKQEVVDAAKTNYLQDVRNKRVHVNLEGLDNRLKLAKCDQRHDLAVQDSLGAGGHVNVSVSCRGLNHWAILVPITASIFRNVPIASRNLPLGTLISDSDINTEERELSDLRLGYYLDSQELVGKQVKFAMNPGDTFKTSWVDAPISVKRGDEVSLESSIGMIKVVTRGTAISDGRIGQQIRVKNNQTDKIVNGRVTAAGQVNTL